MDGFNMNRALAYWDQYACGRLEHFMHMGRSNWRYRGTKRTLRVVDYV